MGKKDEMEKLLEEMLQQFLEAAKSNPQGFKFTIQADDNTPIMFVEIKREEKLKTYCPYAEITETKESVIVAVELQGATYENLQIKMRGKVLKIRARSKTKKYKKELYIHRKVNFSKSVSSLRNGILELILPRK